MSKKENKSPTIEVDEVNLEDLIVLGNEKKIPIEIDYPLKDGTSVKSKAYVTQLTLKEIENLKLNPQNVSQAVIEILSSSLYNSKGENYTKQELNALPIGVVNAITETIMELSGVDIKQSEQLTDFLI